MDRTNRRLELWAVVLISVASVLSAWCAYQSARWGNAQAQMYARANATRVESLRQSGLANRQTMVDINLFVAYESALAQRSTLANFLSQRFPERLKVAVRAWLDQKPMSNVRAPSSPFVMPAYHVAAESRAEALENDAAGYFQDGVSANETADRYVLMTVLFASVSFLAGVGSKFELRSVAAIAMLLGSLVLLVAGAILIAYPIR
ncbi:MAG: hypothetical protein JO098_06145 [Candidatus Eremiobacteraeota bacterium]|nr:hypothetical protein [Candidatus Eremiobacteraeota bacterium]